MIAPYPEESCPVCGALPCDWAAGAVDAMRSREEGRQALEQAGYALSVAVDELPDGTLKTYLIKEKARTFAALAKPTDAAWRLVPAEPTHEMLHAMYQAFFGFVNGPYPQRDGEDALRRAYRAMLAAALRATSETSSVEGR